MILSRCTKQGQQRLEDCLLEYYEKADPSGLLSGKLHLLLAELRKLDFGDPVFCLTSHHKLWLVSKDNPSSTWWASVCANPLGFEIEYRVPDDEAPWPGAFTRGEFETRIQQRVIFLRV